MIFDVDGTLVDSVDLNAQAWQETFRKFGKEIPFQDIRGQIGKGGDQLLPVFFSNEELNKFGKKIKKKRDEIFRKKYLPRTKPFPKGARAFRAHSTNAIIVSPVIALMLATCLHWLSCCLLSCCSKSAMLRASAAQPVGKHDGAERRSWSFQPCLFMDTGWVKVPVQFLALAVVAKAENNQNSLNSPACSCVSIMLPASS